MTGSMRLVSMVQSGGREFEGRQAYGAAHGCGARGIDAVSVMVGNGSPELRERRTLLMVHFVLLPLMTIDAVVGGLLLFPLHLSRQSCNLHLRIVHAPPYNCAQLMHASSSGWSQSSSLPQQQGPDSLTKNFGEAVWQSNSDLHLERPGGLHSCRQAVGAYRFQGRLYAQ